MTVLLLLIVIVAALVTIASGVWVAVGLVIALRSAHRPISPGQTSPESGDD
jgi:hypothetical protein